MPNLVLTSAEEKNNPIFCGRAVFGRRTVPGKGAERAGQAVEESVDCEGPERGRQGGTNRSRSMPHPRAIRRALLPSAVLNAALRRGQGRAPSRQGQVPGQEGRADAGDVGSRVRGLAVTQGREGSVLPSVSLAHPRSECFERREQSPVRGLGGTGLCTARGTEWETQRAPNLARSHQACPGEPRGAEAAGNTN